jgi:hypothetical protein
VDRGDFGFRLAVGRGFGRGTRSKPSRGDEIRLFGSLGSGGLGGAESGFGSGDAVRCRRHQARAACGAWFQRMIGRQIWVNRRPGRAGSTRCGLGGRRRRRRRRHRGGRCRHDIGRLRVGRRLRLWRGVAMQVAFDHGQAIDHVLHGAVHGLKRILGTALAELNLRDFALDRVGLTQIDF